MKIAQTKAASSFAETPRKLRRDLSKSCRKSIFKTLLAAILIVACARENREPQNYDDCVLQTMQANATPVAAAAITSACASKFKRVPPKPEVAPDRALSPDELALLTGRAQDDRYNFEFRGTIHNGNARVVVSEVTLEVTVMTAGQADTKDYSVPLELRPHSAVDFRTKIVFGDKGTNSKWSIKSGRGRDEGVVSP